MPEWDDGRSSRAGCSAHDRTDHVTTADRLLERFLRLWRPRSVLALGAPLPGPLTEYAAAHDAALRTLGIVRDVGALQSLGRFDLAVVTNQLERVPHRDGAELLGRLKNLHTGRVCVLVAPRVEHGVEWHSNDFLGLGFIEPRDQDRQAEQRFFYYDLGSYNPERRWNNPSGWANPENFRRYRW